MLGDAAALAGGHGRRADRVEQAGLAVVDVAHDGHDRRARLEERRLVLLEEDFLGGLRRGRITVLGFGAALLRLDRLGYLVAQLAGDERSRVAVERLVDVGEDAALDQLADHVRGVDAEQLGQLLDRDRVRDLDRATSGWLERLDGRLRPDPVGRRRRFARAAQVARPTRLRAIAVPPRRSTRAPRSQLGAAARRPAARSSRLTSS